jgi:hypothetical protein
MGLPLHRLPVLQLVQLMTELMLLPENPAPREPPEEGIDLRPEEESKDDDGGRPCERPDRAEQI